MTPPAPQAAALARLPVSQNTKAAKLLAAAAHLLASLERGIPLDAHVLREAMTTAFEASDQHGAWLWKDAYEASEAAAVLFLRKYGSGMLRKAQDPAKYLAMLERVAALLPSHTRRSEESDQFQQFSTPLGLGFLMTVAAQLTPGELVLEPSAGTGLLAIHADIRGAELALNELAETRHALLSDLFPQTPVTPFNAEQIDDYLDAAIQPTTVVMNPPFSASPGIERTMRDATVRHIRSALRRLTDGGRLVVLTAANHDPASADIRALYADLSGHASFAFTASVDGRIYARHQGTRGKSLFVKLFGDGAGRWTDAASGEYGDLLDLIRLNKGLNDVREALDEASYFLRDPEPVRNRRTSPAREPQRDTLAAAEKLHRFSRPVPHTLAETYLRGRAITASLYLPALRFHAACYYRPDNGGPRQSWPALLGVVTDVHGNLTGLQRTWLARDGDGKAPLPDPRRALGQLLGNAVRFGAPKDIMAAGEGIETLLSLLSLFPALPMAAGLSASHLAAIQFPRGRGAWRESADHRAIRAGRPLAFPALITSGAASLAGFFLCVAALASLLRKGGPPLGL